LETVWHVAAISILIEALTYLWRQREDYFAGGNNFAYYSEGRRRNEDFRGPDFYVVCGVNRRRKRRFWVVWEEDGKFPNVIVEHLSESTAKEDRTTKKTIYQNTFRTPDYFCYDPDEKRLEGWRLQGGVYQDLQPNERGWLWSEELQLWLGTWVGEYHGLEETWLRFYHPDGRLVLLPGEAEHRRAEIEHHHAMTERQRAETERQRAEQAEAELARLKALLTSPG
jgi:Uma2 family endonuclease